MSDHAPTTPEGLCTACSTEPCAEHATTAPAPVLTPEDVIAAVVNEHGEECFLPRGYDAHDDLVMWMNRMLESHSEALRRQVARLTEDRERLTELRAAVADWVDARNRLAQIPYRPGSIGHTFVANQVERGVARIDAAYAAIDAARREDAATRTGEE